MRIVAFTLASFLICTTAAFGINDELVTEIDFEDFEAGAGNLAPSTGSRPTSVYSFRSDSGALFANSMISGIAEFAEFNKGKQGYLGGLDAPIELTSVSPLFNFPAFAVGFFGGISQELPGSTPVVNLVERGTPILVCSIDFYYEERGSDGNEAVRFFLFDAVDGDDIATFAFHSLVTLFPDGTIQVADRYFDNPETVNVPAGTFVPSKPYRMILVADYENQLWWSSLVNLSSGATTSLASGRSLFTSGFTNPEGSYDIEMAGFDMGDGSVILDDRVYFDNYRVVIRPALPVEISAEVIQSVTLRFESFPGRRYRIQSGPNPGELEPTGEPFFGTGEIIERSFPVRGPGFFYKITESSE